MSSITYRHNRKKSITTQNYEEFRILCALKPAVKMQKENSANSQLWRLFSQNQQNWRRNKAVIRWRYTMSEDLIRGNEVLRLCQMFFAGKKIIIPVVHWSWTEIEEKLSFSFSSTLNFFIKIWYLHQPLTNPYGTDLYYCSFILTLAWHIFLFLCHSCSQIPILGSFSKESTIQPVAHLNNHVRSNAILSLGYWRFMLGNILSPDQRACFLTYFLVS